jgi:acetylornithine deacetylase/succinyl-diaminopimelate desuccinylase family protein
VYDMQIYMQVCIRCLPKTVQGETACRTMSGAEMALTAEESRVLAAVDEAALTDLLQGLVRCPSPNPPGGEERTVAYLAKACEEAGLTVELDEVLPGRPNLYASAGPGGDGAILVLGHTDTVPAGEGWTYDPYGGVVDSGRLFGRGAADMKGGLAAAVAAMGALLRAGAPLREGVTLAAVIDEEEHGQGVRAFLSRRPKARCALVPEPTDLDTVIACRGNCYVEIAVEGRAAHAGSAELGRNAIYGAVRAVESIRRLDEELAAHTHPLLGRAAWSVGTIHGGTATATVPAGCSVSVDRRLLPGQTGAQALNEVERALGGLALEDDGLRAGAELLMEIPSFELPSDDPFVQLVHRASVDAGAPERPLGGWTAACDGGYLIRDGGIPSIVLGPGSVAEQAHKPDESIELMEVVLAARIYALALLRLLSASP